LNAHTHGIVLQEVINDSYQIKVLFCYAWGVCGWMGMLTFIVCTLITATSGWCTKVMHTISSYSANFIVLAYKIWKSFFQIVEVNGHWDCLHPQINWLKIMLSCRFQDYRYTLYICCISVVVVWHYVWHVANHLAYLHGLSQLSVVVFLFYYRFFMVCDNLFL
jgi:hypothetical protein